MLDRFLSKCTDHLSLFAAPATLESSFDIDVDASDTVTDVLRQNVPFVMMDLPHVWTSWAQKIVMESDEVVIVAAPDLANLRNAKNLVDVVRASRANDGPPHVIINMIGMPKRPEISANDFAQAIEMRPTAVIDFDPQTFGTAANNGQMIEELAPKHRAAEIFRDLALQLTHRVEQKTENSSLFAPILSKLSLGKAG